MFGNLIVGDCLDILRDLDSNSIDLVVTSPPYMDKRSDVYSNIESVVYLEFLIMISDEVMRVLRPTGSFVVNIKEGCEKGVRETYVLEYQLYMSRAYRWVDTYIWSKSNPFPTGSNRRLKDAWEHCFHFTKTKDYKFFPQNCLVPSQSKWLPGEKRRKNKGAHPVNNGSTLNIDKRLTNDLVRPSNVINLPSSCLNLPHPAVFPIELPSFFISLMTEENDVVCDPYVGSGSTILAAQQLNRSYIGVDISSEYIELTKKRLGDFISPNLAAVDVTVVT